MGLDDEAAAVGVDQRVTLAPARFRQACAARDAFNAEVYGWQRNAWRGTDQVADQQSQSESWKLQPTADDIRAGQ
jgi:hypothetical protein